MTKLLYRASDGDSVSAYKQLQEPFTRIFRHEIRASFDGEIVFYRHELLLPAFDNFATKTDKRNNIIRKKNIQKFYR